MRSVPIGSASGTGVNSLAIAVPVGGVPAGVAIVVTGTDTSPGFGALADSQGGAYEAVSQQAPANGATVFIGVSTNGNALSHGQTITYTLGQAGQNAVIEAFYVTGANISLGNNVIDSLTLNGNDGTSAAPSVTAGAQAQQPGEMFIAVAGSASAVGSFTQDTTDAAWSAPPGETSIAGPTLAGGTVINPATAALTYGPMFGTSVPWAAVMISLIPLEGEWIIKARRRGRR